MAQTIRVVKASVNALSVTIFAIFFEYIQGLAWHPSGKYTLQGPRR